MSKTTKVLIALLILGAILVTPGIIGVAIYAHGMGASALACPPNIPFLKACVMGSYVLLSFALGGIMWVVALVIGLVKWVFKN